MAIALVPEGSTGAPITADDYSKQNALISANEVPKLSIMTDWASVGAAPLLKLGTFIRHMGNTYQVQTADEAISGAPVAGINYIKLTLAGSVITAEWVNALTGYAYNAAYGGIYNGDATPKQLLSDVVFLDGSDYIRGRGLGQDFNFVYLANGLFFANGAYSVAGDFAVSGKTTTNELEVTTGAAVGGDAAIGGDLTMTGTIKGGAFGSISSVSVGSDSYFTLPAGLWLVSRESSCVYGFRRDTGNDTEHQVSTLVISDGTTRYYNYSISSWTYYYRPIG